MAAGDPIEPIPQTERIEVPRSMLGRGDTFALRVKGCLLYTSDAADDLLCVDLGGRRIIKKKKNQTTTSNTTSHDTHYNTTTDT